MKGCMQWSLQEKSCLQQDSKQLSRPVFHQLSHLDSSALLYIVVHVYIKVSYSLVSGGAVIFTHRRLKFRQKCN